jgi:predicted SprT family Zn-dependent metalloprotease
MSKDLTWVINYPILTAMELLSIFEQLNRAHFDGFLDPPALRWNARLRSSAGRFIPGSRRHADQAPPVIEVATYLQEERDAQALIIDTVGHEMIHYWLWVMQRPYGHTPEFWSKMQEMGVSRYNWASRVRPFRYLYRCLVCEKDFPTRKKLGVLACEGCCKEHANGKFDSRYLLQLDRILTAEEGIELSRQQSGTHLEASASGA